MVRAAMACAMFVPTARTVELAMTAHGNTTACATATPPRQASQKSRGKAHGKLGNGHGVSQTNKRAKRHDNNPGNPLRQAP